MDFEQKIEEIIKGRMANKKAIAENLGMPYTTFLYKCKSIDRWQVMEFKALAEALRLTDQEVDFLCNRV